MIVTNQAMRYEKMKLHALVFFIPKAKLYLVLKSRNSFDKYEYYLMFHTFTNLPTYALLNFLHLQFLNSIISISTNNEPAMMMCNKIKRTI